MTVPSDIVTTRSVNIRYIRSLDQLRAVAVLMVFFAHCLHNFTRGMDATLGAWLFPSNPVLSVIAEGHSGVALFMVLSGFLFAYGAFGKEVIYFKFLRNRVLRIFPMYLLMLLLGAYAYPGTFSFISFLSSLFLFSNTSGALNGGMFTILLWTISTEFTFYLIFPYLHRMFGISGSGFLFKFILLAIVLRVICVALGSSPRDFSYFTIFGRIDQFILGMLSAYYLLNGRFHGFSSRLAFGVSIFAVVISLYLFNVHGGGWVSESRWKILWPTWEGIVFSALVIAFIKNQRSEVVSFPGRAAVFIGSVSFSIYLLHQPVINVMQRAKLVFVTGMGVQADALLTGGFVFLAVLALSWLTFELIERPFMAMRSGYFSDSSGRDVNA
jgi:peptidoglycan/LPS O-acetylase OafA/YrhL